MSSRTRRLVGALSVAAGLLFLFALPDVVPEVRAQIKVLQPAIPIPIDKAGDKTAFAEAVTVPTNRESKRLIQAAQDYIKKKEWGTAAECLQQLLEDKQDSFIEIDAG